jgi:hypothetical protein
MMKFSALLATATFFLPTGSAFGQPNRVDFTEPKNGAAVTVPCKTKILVTGRKVSPAREMAAGAGHHHRIVNGSPIQAGEVAPFWLMSFST